MSPRPPSSVGGPRSVLVLAPDSELIWGRNAVTEALRAGRRVRRLLVLEEAMEDTAVVQALGLARERRIPVDEMFRRQMEAVAPEHQGLVAVVGPFPYVGWGDLLARLKQAERPPALLLLDTLQDPQNLGTLMRAAEAVGVDGVILPKRRSVEVTGAVVRSSAGAVEQLSVAQVPNLPRAAGELKEMGVWVAGIDAAGDLPYWDLDMTGPTALVLGGEDHGIGRLMKESCDFLIRLPMLGKVTSLNAAAAGSIVLYELLRQRLRAPGEERPGAADSGTGKDAKDTKDTRRTESAKGTKRHEET